MKCGEMCDRMKLLLKIVVKAVFISERVQGSLTLPGLKTRGFLIE